MQTSDPKYRAFPVWPMTYLAPGISEPTMLVLVLGIYRAPTLCWSLTRQGDTGMNKTQSVPRRLPPPQSCVAKWVCNQTPHSPESGAHRRFTEPATGLGWNRGAFHGGALHKEWGGGGEQLPQSARRQPEGVRKGLGQVRFRERSLVAEWRRDRVGKDWGQEPNTETTAGPSWHSMGGGGRWPGWERWCPNPAPHGEPRGGI